MKVRQLETIPCTALAHNPNATTVNSTDRFEYIDIAKGIAILCVMISHMHGGWLHKILFSFEVPIFFFLSGFCLNLKRKTAEVAFIRFKQLGVPFLLVAGVLIVVRCCTLFLENNISALAFFQCVITTLKGHFSSESMGPFWFLPALWVATITVRWLFETKHAPVFICFASAIGAISIKYITLPLSIQLGLASGIYLYAGCLCKQYKLMESIIFRDNLYICASILLWLYGIYTYHVGLSVPLSIPQVITAFAAFPAFIYLSRLLTTCASWCKELFKFLGRHTLFILGLHTLDITLGMHRYIPTELYRPYSRIALTCILVLICSFLLKAFREQKKRQAPNQTLN